MFSSRSRRSPCASGSIKAEIDAVQAKLVCVPPTRYARISTADCTAFSFSFFKNAVKEKLSGGGKGGPAQERRKQLLAELAEIRNAQGNVKQKRDKVFEQLKGIQDGIQKKVRCRRS